MKNPRLRSRFVFLALVLSFSLMFVILAPASLQAAPPAKPALAPFRAGNVVVYRVGDGSAVLSNAGTAVYLDEYTSGGTLVQSFAMPTEVNGPHRQLVASGTSTSEGLITRSTDGHYLVLTGYGAAVGTASLSGSAGTTYPRVVGRMDWNSSLDTTTALTDFSSAGSPRSAVSTDGTVFWGSGAAGGVRYAALGATTSTQLNTAPTNLRQLNIFNGQLYVSTASGTAFRLGAVGTGLPTTTGTTISNLTGLPTSTTSPYGFYFADLNGAIPGADTVYIAADDTGVLKYSLVGDTWTSNGTVGASTDTYRGLTGTASGNTVTLYATRKGSELVQITDTSGYNGTFTSSPTLLATAGTNTAFRGVALAPVQAALLPNLTINDVAQNEGNSGTVTFSFTVSLSAPAPVGGVTFDIATADGTATAPGDYTSRSLTGVTIPEGSTTYTFDVQVNGDTTYEPNETFFVNVTSISGATFTDVQGMGTIVNDDAAPVPVVTSTDPANAATGILPNKILTVNFNPTVNVASGGVTLQCNSSTITLNGLPQTGQTSITLTPAAPLPFNASCTGTVHQALVTATSDGTPMASDYTWSFDTVAVLSIGAVNGIVPDGANITTYGSPYKNTTVTVQGVVYEKTLSKTSGGSPNYGFFIQNKAADADGNPNSSDGLFVYLGTSTTIDKLGGGTWTPVVGDEIIVTGKVSEYYNYTELVSPLSLLMDPVNHYADVDAVIPAFDANPPPAVSDSNVYWERRQSMRARIASGSIVSSARIIFSPVDAEVWVTPAGYSPIMSRSDPFARRAFRDAHPLDDNYDPNNWDGNGYRVDIGSMGIKGASGNMDDVIDPLRAFDVLAQPVVGGVNYTYSKYRVEIDGQPTVTQPVNPTANNPPQVFDRTLAYSIADYNLENLYDYRNNPASGCDFSTDSGCPAAAPFPSAVNPPFDYVPASQAAYDQRVSEIASQIINVLKSPDILMVQEVENQDMCKFVTGVLTCGSGGDGQPDSLQDLALAIKAIDSSVDYASAFDADASDLRGILPAFMYRTDRVQLAPTTGDPILGSTNPVISSYGSVSYDADISNPKALNAPYTGTGACETSYVFPRAATVGLFRIRGTGASADVYQDVYIVNNHFKSTPNTCVAHRTEQANYNAAIVAAIQAANPSAKVVVGGDLNVYPRPDDPVAPPGTPNDQLKALYDNAHLKNLLDVLLTQAPASAYSYVYGGMAQTLDQMFVNQNLLPLLQQFRIAHVNSDFPPDLPGSDARGTSDHDPSVGVFSLLNPTPTLSSLSPNSAKAGGPSFTLTVNGSDFVGGAIVKWGGVALTTTYVSSTQVTASVPAANIATVGTVNVTVLNPTPTSGESTPLTFGITQVGAQLVLSDSKNPSKVGETVTFTATLTQAYDKLRGRNVVPSGTVTFTVDSQVAVTRTVDANGIATYTTSSLPKGTHTIGAAYSGDVNLAPAQANPLTHVVGSVSVYLPEINMTK